MVASAVQPGRERVENVSAVELAAGDEIQRGDEEADPSGHEHRMRRSLMERGNDGFHHQQTMQQLDGQRVAAKADEGLRCAAGLGHAQQKSHGDGQRRGDIAGQRPVDSHVHERIAAGDARADADDGAESSAERGRGKHPGQSGANAVREAGGVVAELVDQEDAEQRKRISKARGEEAGMAKEPSPGPQVTVAHHRRQAFEEVLHEPCAVHGGGDDAGGEKQQPASHTPEK